MAGPAEGRVSAVSAEPSRSVVKIDNEAVRQ